MSATTEDESKLDETLDPIRPLSMGTGEMSYIYGRDPSILSYGQRPGPSVETKRNLDSVYEVEETVASLDVSSAQTIKVYLRLKPFGKKEKLTAEEENAYRITGRTSLLTKLPCQDTHTSIRSSSIDFACRNYTFTETFGPEVTQEEFFDRVLRPQMPDFLQGQNATIMTYGTTNSGKSFTLQGTSMEPGLIPRSLEHLFSRINPKETPDFKPLNNSEVIELSSSEKSIEIDNKSKLMTYGTTDRNQYLNAYKKMQQVLRKEDPESRSRESTDAQCAVWVSFAEIYNETIYDLLSNDSTKRCPILKLATDSQGATYIKGLKSVFVNSGCEAYQVLMAGQYNLKIAATALNTRSSRSHCIFTIRLLRYFSENDPKSVQMSTFNFCDLAGSERLKKTLNIGDRLKEAQNINTSLMVLGRCLKSIYEVQTVKQQRSEVIGPFRESKLTRLFQAALSGREPIALIVNVNPSPNLYVETQNVLNFAAIAKKIIIQPKVKKPRRSKTRFSQLVLQTKDTVTDWEKPTTECDLESIDDQSSVEEMGYVPAEDYEQILIENQNLRKEIEQMKASAFKKDLATREEISKLYIETIKKMEENFKTRLSSMEAEHQNLHEWELEKVETYYQNKLKAVKSCKRRRMESDDEDEDDDSDVDTTKDELEIQVQQLTSKVNELKEKLKTSTKEKDAALVEKNTVIYQLSLMKEELKAAKNIIVAFENSHVDAKMEAYIEELKEQLAECEKKKKLHECTLNEAKKDFINLRNEIEGKDREINQLKIELAHKDAELTDLLGEYENTEYDLSQKKVIIREYEEIIDSQTQKLHRLTNEYDELKRMYQESTKETVLEIKERNSITNEIVRTLENKLVDAENKIFALNEKLLDKNIIIEELERKLSTPKENCDLADLEAKYNDEQERRKKFEAQLESCKLSIEELEEQNEELKASRDYYRADVKNIEKELTESKKMIASLTGDLTEKEHETAELTNRVKDFEQLVADLTNEILKLRSLKISYEEKLKKKDKELTAIKDKIVSVENELEEKKNLADVVEKEKEINRNIKSQVDTLNQEIHQLNEEKKNFESLVESEKEINREMKSQIDTLKQKIDQLNDENEKLKELEKKQEIKLSEVMEELSEKKKQILEMSKNDLEINELKQQVEKVENLEKELAEAKTLESRVSELMTKQQKLEKAKKTLEIKIGELEKTITEKDKEINDLQKEIKDSIKLKENDDTAKELKLMIKERDEAKEKLSEIDVLNKQLQIKINNNDREIDKLRRTIKQYEEKLDRANDREINYQKTIEGKELELETFKKNRDEMVSKNEDLIQKLTDDLQAAKQEIKKLQNASVAKVQTPRNAGDDFRVPFSDKSPYNFKEKKPIKEETSEDESVTERRGRRGRKVLEPTSPNENLAVNEASETESTRSTRKTTAKSTAPSSERKTRGRRLYTPIEDGLLDIPNSIENIPSPSPSPSTRSLRSRRK